MAAAVAALLILTLAELVPMAGEMVAAMVVLERLQRLIAVAVVAAMVVVVAQVL